MNRPGQNDSSLSPYRSFVVQFVTVSVLAENGCAGRVEHVVSGESAHFASATELLAFMARLLATLRVADGA